MLKKIYSSATKDKMNITKTAREYLLERCDKRKCIIYGTGKRSRKMSRLLSALNINVEYYVDDNPTTNRFNKKEVRNYLDVVYEVPGSIFIIIAKDNESYAIPRQKFLHLGLCENIDFTYYKAVPYYEVKGVPDREVPFYYDVTLSFNRKREEIEGFEVFGDIDNPKALKIVALGGSTTESTLEFVKGWAHYLTDMIEYPVVMYCGGIAGYTSSQELLKLIRDVLPMKPDVILSYSGVNDFLHGWRLDKKSEGKGRPFLTDFQVTYIKSVLSRYPKENRNVYYGLQNNKKLSELWLDNTRIMHAISEEFGILFLSFLQPIFFVGDYKLTDSQKIVFNRNWWMRSFYPNPDQNREEHMEFMKRGFLELRDSVKDIDYITDFIDIFSDCQKIVYKDFCHLTDYGNQIVAENIYRVLNRHLEDGGENK